MKKLQTMNITIFKTDYDLFQWRCDLGSDLGFDQTFSSATSKECLANACRVAEQLGMKAVVRRSRSHQNRGAE